MWGCIGPEGGALFSCLAKKVTYGLATWHPDPAICTDRLDRGISQFPGGHISLVAAFKGQNVILGLYKCNYSLSRGKELGAATRQKQGVGLDKTKWRS